MLEKQELYNKIFPIVSSIINYEIKNKNNNVSIKTYEEIYILEIFKNGIVPILRENIQLNHIPIFIRRFPFKDFYEKNNINYPKYLEYHFENHYVKLNTILDQILNLINIVYGFNINVKYNRINILELLKKENINFYNILNNYKKFLKSIPGSGSDLVDPRHIILHADFYDIDINFIDCLYEDKCLENYIKLKIKDIKNDKLKIIIDNIEKSEDMTRESFDYIYKYLKNKLKDNKI